jgi:hypothetical protein
MDIILLAVHWSVAVEDLGKMLFLNVVSLDPLQSIISFILNETMMLMELRSKSLKL